MLLRVLALPFLLISATVNASELPTEIIEYVDDTKVATFINEDDIDSVTPWVPFDGPPPLTTADALALVQEFIGRDTEIADSELRAIELRRIPHHELHWHYVVRMKTRTRDKPRSQFFTVLMNGKIIPGITEPEGIK